MSFDFKLSKDGVNVLDATEEELLLSLDKPLAKLDTANEVSFQNIRLNFATDPPEPNATTVIYADTLVYEIEHGYDYIPSFWSLIRVMNPPNAGVPFSQAYFQDSGVVSGVNAFTLASFSVKATDTKIQFWIQKYRDVGSPVNPLIGLILQIRLYVFADDLQF